MRTRVAQCIGVVAGIAVAAGLGCRRPSPSELTAALVEPAEGRFPHGSHTGVACVECHALEAVTSGRPAVPGADDHAPCDRDNCHRAEFVAPPGALCTLCHLRVDPRGAEPPVAAPYPPTRGPRALAAEFSHTTHLDFARMERQVGFHVSCSDCHLRRDAATDPDRPGHLPCLRCHAREAAPPGAPSMDRCDGCHVPRGASLPRARSLIVDDLRFDHVTHEADRAGRPIRCVVCHTRITEVARTGTHPAPPTVACVECHDDEERTPPERRIRVCETCHLSRTESFGSLAPRSHLPPTERPEDHTIAFRTDHAEDALGGAARCARCHQGMSGSSRDVCDECHQSMKPRDHTVGWREFDHGSAAATTRDRCATCHVGEFCTACHSRPPRSHFPMMVFRDSSHGELARLEPRACLTCHTIERDCTGGACHVVGPAR